MAEIEKVIEELDEQRSKQYGLGDDVCGDVIADAIQTIRELQEQIEYYKSGNCENDCEHFESLEGVRDRWCDMSDNEKLVMNTLLEYCKEKSESGKNGLWESTAIVLERTIKKAEFAEINEHFNELNETQQNAINNVIEAMWENNKEKES